MCPDIEREHGQGVGRKADLRFCSVELRESPKAKIFQADRLYEICDHRDRVARALGSLRRSCNTAIYDQAKRPQSALVEVDPRPVGLQAVAIASTSGTAGGRAHKKTRAAARTTSPAAVPSHTGLPLQVLPTLAGGLVVLLASLKVSRANARSDAELHGDHLDPRAT